MTIVATEGGSKQTVDSVSAAGAMGHSEITVRFDGTDYPMQGSTNTDTQAYTQIDDRTLQIVEKKGGKDLSRRKDADDDADGHESSRPDHQERHRLRQAIASCRVVRQSGRQGYP